MNYYNVLLLSCAVALFVLVLMRLREIFQEKQAKAIAEMEKAAQESEENEIPDHILAIFSEGGKTYEGWARQDDINKLKRIHVAAKQLIECNETNAVQLFAQLERVLKS